MKMLISLLRSFYYAFSGLITAIKNERNFRIEILAIIYVSLFSLFYGLERAESAVLVLTFCLVPSLELVNTAIENTVNLAKERSPIAKAAKDTAAAAVLFAAINAVVVAICLFSDPERLSYAMRTLFSVPWIIIVAVSIIPAVLFVCLPGKNLPKK